jgi:DNA-binding NarL/FixJ family response regulator
MDVERKPEYAVLQRAAVESVTLTRDEIWGRGAWYRSRTYREVHGACGLDDYILSMHRVPGTELTVSVWVHRAVGDAGFGEGDRAGVELLHGRVAGLVGRALASAREATAAEVRGRRREVLGAVLEGLSEKEIGGKLGIGVATVHEHVLGLYRHFGVRTRAELMARWVGREKPGPTV